ncbi:MAG: toluene monooxygenase [Acidimicrobiia bacterium]
MPLRRDDWLDVARKVDWNFRYVSEEDVYPATMSGTPWLPHEAWKDWNEVYRNTYREYVENQMQKDEAILAVRDTLGKAKHLAKLDPAWVSLAKFHNGAIALGEYAAMIAELRMQRFGRDGAWRTMAGLGSLDEMRHTQIPLLLSHDLLKLDAQFDWAHKGYHTNEWGMIAARHLFDDMFTAANAIDTAVQLTFVFETGFTNLQFIAMAAMADGAEDHVFEKALASIQTDESRHAQQGHPVLRTLIDNGGREYVQYLLDKMWWRSWRIFVVLTGTSMDYLTPLEARRHSFKEFMEEWIIDQFIKNLEEFGLDKPWFWDVFVEELDHMSHLFQMGLYTYRQTLWFDECMPNPDEREWLVEKYPTTWAKCYGPLWDNIEKNWEQKGEFATLPYSLPSLCNLCQLPGVGIGPHHNTSCTLRVGERNYFFCSEPCRWIFQTQQDLFKGHRNVIDRIFEGDAPTDINAVLTWMGFESVAEQGKDMHRGKHPWLTTGASA